MTVIAGVDIGNATTEVVLYHTEERTVLASGRVPTRGRKGSGDSVRAAAALIRRLERQASHAGHPVRVTQARVAPLRAAVTAVVTVPGVPSATGRLRVLAAGVATPGGAGACVAPPHPLAPHPPVNVPMAPMVRPSNVPMVPTARELACRWHHRHALQRAGDQRAGDQRAGDQRAGDQRAEDQRAGDQRAGDRGVTAAGVVAVVPAGVSYEVAAERVRGLLDAGLRVDAVLTGGDEGVLIANRLPVPIPVIDQVDTEAAARCALLAVEVRPAGHPMTLIGDAVALAARFGLAGDEAGAAAAVSRALAGRSNAVIGLLPEDRCHGPEPGRQDEPWLRTADGARLSLREACPLLPGWPPGTVRESRGVPVADLYAVDLATVAEQATARRGSTGHAIVTAMLAPFADEHADQHADGQGAGQEGGPAAWLAGLLGIPVTSPLTEPAAARLGALTTPGARQDALVIDLGAGTIDVIGPDGDVVAAGAGDLLTAVIAGLLGIPKAAADWVKRDPCVRLDGQRYEAEDGSRGFLPAPAPAAAGMLAVHGPGGWLPFGSRHSPVEWRALRIRSKDAVMRKNVERAVRALGAKPSQVLMVGGPAGDEELLSVLAGTGLAGNVPFGRGNVLGSLGHRYAVALGLALAP